MALLLTLITTALATLGFAWWLLRSAAINGSADGLERPPHGSIVRDTVRSALRRTAARVDTSVAGGPSVLSRSQAVWALIVLAGIGYGIDVAPEPTIAVVNGLLIVFLASAFAFKLVLIGTSLSRPMTVTPAGAARLPAEEFAVYTVMLPLYHEAAVLPQLLNAIRGLHYPPELLDVKLLLEEGDLETARAVAGADLPDYFEVLTVPDDGPRGKARACNFGLARARGEFLVIFDAEDCPDPDQLAASVAAFRNQADDVVCLQAQLNCFNREHNLLTRWFTAEYSVWFDQLLPGLSALDAPIPLGGTSNHFVTARLREIGGWDVYNVTEDAELGVRVSMHGWKTAILGSTTYEEATGRYGNWLRQRSRWVKGYMQTYLRYMRHPVELWRQIGTTGFGVFQLFFGANTVCLLLNPVYWALVVVWFVWRPSWIESIFPGPVFYIALFGLIVGNVACLLAMVSGCYGRRNYADVKWALLSPLYWLLMSVAAYKALVQLIYKPWYWEKTEHGFCVLDGEANGFKAGFVPPPMPAPSPRPPLAPLGPPSRIEATRRGHSRFHRSALSAWCRKTVHHELTAVVAAATVVAVGATLWSLATHSLVLYGDAAAHLDVARRVTDGVTEGLAQLGSVWLPLPHLLLVPLVAITALWHSGLAGSIVSGACFVYAAVRTYSLVYELSGSRVGAWCAFAVLVTNLNLLYVQTTALTEPVLIAFIVGSVFHFARWLRTFSMTELVWTAVLTACATLARYEGWAVLAAEVIAVVAWGRLADRRKKSPQANSVLFVLIGSYGIGLWFLYNLIIFHDPLYFMHSIYSAQAINGGQAQFGLLGTKGHLGTTLLTFGWDLVGIVGPPALIAAALSIALLGARDRRRRRTLFVLCLLAAPVAFDAATLYAGQITIRVSELAPHQLWNLRYGLIALPLCAVAVGCVAARSRIFAAAAIAATAATAVLMAVNTPVTLTDGRAGVSRTTAGSPPLAAVYLHDHYRGGEVLADDGSASSLIFESDLDLDQFITPGDRPYWERALASPAAHAVWMVVYPDDAVATDMRTNPSRFSAYRLVTSSGRATLYERDATVVRAATPTAPASETTREAVITESPQSLGTSDSGSPPALNLGPQPPFAPLAGLFASD
jgi:cellulose synthase/poly-beta-1,6-N-acetylglucosamine synthase-like glycosyltransferase